MGVFGQDSRDEELRSDVGQSGVRVTPVSLTIARVCGPSETLEASSKVPEAKALRHWLRYSIAHERSSASPG